MIELIANIHMHTVYSDGTATHELLANAAMNAKVDVILVTDHNILVQEMGGYYQKKNSKVLVIIGEEIHDQTRFPQKNHLLVFGVDKEFSDLAKEPQVLIDAVRNSGGLCFLAHPLDPSLPGFGETDISWEDWKVTGFTGLELWNGFSELKIRSKGSKWAAILFGLFPSFIPFSPHEEVLRKWDELIARKKRVVAIGGSDAHAQHRSIGPIHKVIFPYEYHFSSINTHILVPSKLSGDASKDQEEILNALMAGHCFIGNDLPYPTRGFSFTAHGRDSSVIMGDQITPHGSLTLQAKIPADAELSLIKNGKLVHSVFGQSLVFTTEEAGIFRVEAHKKYLGKSRGWIFSNPIYVI
jgi:hypothetical protein